MLLIDEDIDLFSISIYGSLNRSHLIHLAHTNQGVFCACARARNVCDDEVPWLAFLMLRNAILCIFLIKVNLINFN